MFDPRPAEGDPSREVTDAEGAALDSAAGELDAVEAALRRLDDGTFDRCQVCGRPVGVDRLREDPLLTRCVEHPATGLPGGESLER